MVDLKATGKLIAECRKEKNLTQKQLGEKLHVTDRAVSKWETGKAFPDVHIMEELCRELEISVSDLLAGKRIETEQYQEETEKMLLMSVSQTQLYGFQIILYILFFVSLIAFDLLIVVKGDTEWLKPNYEMAACGLIWGGTLVSIAYLDRKLPARRFRSSNSVLEGIMGAVYFLFMMGSVFYRSGGLEGMALGEQIFVVLFWIVCLLFAVWIRASMATEVRSKWENDIDRNKKG